MLMVIRAVFRNDNVRIRLEIIQELLPTLTGFIRSPLKFNAVKSSFASISSDENIWFLLFQ